ncbi:MAG: hypothetical protein ABSE55_05380 [Terracidiphilus sp.]|jgi:hypothetical protein
MNEPLIRSGGLFLVGQGDSFYRQLTDSFFRVVGGGVVVREKAKSIVVHSAPLHGFSFKELKFRSPSWVGVLELLISLFRCLLAIGQSTLMEELQGVVICVLGAAGTAVFQKEQKR